MPEITIGDNASPAFTEALNVARLLGNNWRTGRDNQRKLARHLIVAVAVDNYAFGPMKDEIKSKMGKLSKDDQNGLKTLFSTCGFVIDRFHTISGEQRDAFIAGTLLYSTLAADMRTAEKAKEKADAEAAETERLAELGITPEQAKEAEQRETDANANVAAVERVLVLLGQSERNEGENAALARLFDAVDQFRAATVEQAQAA